MASSFLSGSTVGNELIATQPWVLEQLEEELSLYATVEQLEEAEKVAAAALNELEETKQDVLTAGDNIHIVDDVISVYGIPTKLSELTNDTGFIDKTVNDLVNYYKKTETYTQAEVNSLISSITHFHYEVYASLDEITDPKTNVLYLIGPKGEGSDKYEEYVYSEGSFIKIGDTSIDLSNYYNKTQTDALLAAKEDKSNKVVTLSGDVTDEQYPSAKAVYDTITSNEKVVAAAINELNEKKQNVLTAGDNINIEDDVISVSGMPTAVSDLINDEGFITSGVSELANYYNKTQTGNLLDEKEDVSNKVTVLDGTVTDSQYPSAKVVYDTITENEEVTAAAINELEEKKQDVLTAGDNIQIEDNVISVSGMPTAVSDLINDEGFITNEVSDLVNYYDKAQTDTLLGDKEDASNKVVTLSGDVTDEQYPSAKAVYDVITSNEKVTAAAINELNEKKQDVLTAGDNIHIIDDVISVYGIPTKLSELTNDTGFSDKSLNDLVNYYKKTETYTQEEVNNLIGSISHFHYEVYASLDEITDPKTNVLYLIGPKGEGSDKYEEYVYSSGSFIKIGDTSIDLSNYYNKTQTDALLAVKEDKSNKVVTLSGNVTDEQYPSAKAVYDTITENEEVTAAAINELDEKKQNVLTAGDNINIEDDVISVSGMPTAVSELVNDEGFITNEVSDLVNYYNKTQTDNLLDEKEDASNKVVTLSGDVTDEQYPSAKAVYDVITSNEKVTAAAINELNEKKQNVLTAGDNINIEDDVISVSGIPTKLSELTNDEGFITNEVSDLVNYYNKNQTDTLLGDKEDASNKVTTLDGTATDNQYPSAKVVYDTITENEEVTAAAINELDEKKQNVLTAGDNISIEDDVISVSGMPTAVSDLINDEGFVTNEVSDLVNYYDKTQTDTLLGDKEDASNKVTVLDEAATDSQYPSAKVVYDVITSNEKVTAAAINELEETKQDVLTAGDNIHIVDDVISVYGIPTKLSELTNDEGFIDKSVNDLVNYYKKVEIYTQGEVNSLISSITHFHYEVYASLDEITDPKTNVLYLIGPTGTGADKYEEYVYSDGSFIKIGDTSIDLSNYYNKAQTDALLGDKEDTSNKITTLDETTTDNQYPSAKAVYDVITSNEKVTAAAINELDEKKQDTLTAGDNVTIEDGIISVSGIPTAVSELVNDEGFITSGVSDLANYYNKTLTDTLLGGKEDTSNKVTVLDGTATDNQYPSAKAVYDTITENEEVTAEAINELEENKQEKLFERGTGENSIKIKDNGGTATGQASGSLGIMTNSDGIGSVAFGRETEASGTYSMAINSHTTADGEASFASGYNTQSVGQYSHAEGQSSISKGKSSHVEGFGGVADVNAEAAHVEGFHTTANSLAEHAEGQYNVSHIKTTGSSTQKKEGTTIHSIGIGSSTNLKNAVEVMQNGDVYVNGLGGYDGARIKTQDSSIKTLQEIISTFKSVFVAEYGTTSYADIQTAYNAGKTIICTKGTEIYPLAGVYQEEFDFGIAINGGVRYLSCHVDEGWFSNSIDLETVVRSTDGEELISGKILIGDGENNTKSSSKSLSDIQDKLIAGTGISIAADGKTISAASGASRIQITEDMIDYNEEYDACVVRCPNHENSNIVYVLDFEDNPEQIDERTLEKDIWFIGNGRYELRCPCSPYEYQGELKAAHIYTPKQIDLPIKPGSREMQSDCAVIYFELIDSEGIIDSCEVLNVLGFGNY